MRDNGHGYLIDVEAHGDPLARITSAPLFKRAVAHVANEYVAKTWLGVTR